MLGADEDDLAVAIATVFGTIHDPRKRLRAIRVGKVVLQNIALATVAESRKSGSTWRQIASDLGETRATAYRHYGKDDHPDDLELGEEAEG